MKNIRTKQGIVLYDFLLCQGGGEKVTIELAQGLTDVDLCVGFRNHKIFPVDLLESVNCIELAGWNDFYLPTLRTLKGIRDYYSRTAFLREYDWVIYSGSNAPVAVHNHPQGRNIYYCHTIPRFAYDLNMYYMNKLPYWQQPVLHALVPYVKHHFESAMAKMDIILANSETVRDRIRQYLGLDAKVVYPPCDVEGYNWIEQGDYYLSTARLEPYKRIDVIIDAFRKMTNKQLVVASGGSDEKRLKHLANNAENISFVGWQNDLQLKELVGRSIATIYVPRDEDFGMSPVESMAAGKPVIGVAEGGLLETIIDGETGFLVSQEPTAEDIIAAVKCLSPKVAMSMRKQCEVQSMLFSREIFLKKMRAIINEDIVCY